ncbi:hypothetical protein GCM10012287_55640 [Streptomyces daqingensis]|uniref:N-acetyltransferase domain-containing protein n=1 Tax=Streptomyces daqingensis TaxID=1472640 RepID=A0ABQ2MST5_9ACTN|nr:hypothetical protein GCM10012287_55640 [Streptomyces daqingensis]
MPTPLHVRPAAPGDAAGVCELLNTAYAAETGSTGTDPHTVASDLEHPQADLARNSWLAFRSGELVAYGLLWNDSGAERVDVDLYVQPGHEDAGGRLLPLMEARAAENAAEAGSDRAVVHLTLASRTTVDTGELRSRGWRTVRRHDVLTRVLSATEDTPPPPLGGLALRDCRDEADRRRAHELVEETFADHYDHHPRRYEDWLDDLGQGMDWSLVWIAALEGRGGAWPCSSPATTARPRPGSTTWASGTPPGVRASAVVCCGTPSASTRPAAGRGSASAWTPETRRARCASTPPTG